MPLKAAIGPVFTPYCIAPADAMVIDFGVKNLWLCEIAFQS
jgi:hypothetical protein